VGFEVNAWAGLSLPVEAMPPPSDVSRGGNVRWVDVFGGRGAVSLSLRDRAAAVTPLPGVPVITPSIGSYSCEPPVSRSFGGARCRVHLPEPGGVRGWRADTGPRRGAGGRSRVGCGWWFGRGGPAGGVGHCAAMSESNSARTQSWSELQSARNASSLLRSACGVFIAAAHASIERRSLVALTVILRGLARSATGICTVRTPAS